MRMAPRTGSAVSFIVTRMVNDDGELSMLPEGTPPAVFVSTQTGVCKDAESKLALGESAAALTTLDAAPSSAAATALRVRALLMEGRRTEARAMLVAHTDVEPIATAMVALSDNRIEEAGQIIHRAAMERPSDISVAYVQALVRLAEGDIHTGLQQLTDICASDGTHALARAQLGQLMLSQGDPARAGTLFEQAIVLAPTFMSPVLSLAEMLSEARQVGEALAVLQAACDRAPDALAPRQMQMRLLIEMGEARTALSLGETLHAQVPHDVDTALLYAEALIDSRDTDTAASVLEDVEGSVDASNRYRVLRLQAHVQLENGRVEEGLATYRQAAQAASADQSGNLWVELIQMAQSRRRTVEMDSALVELGSSSDVHALVNGALIARQQGLSSRAKRLAERAQDMVRGSPADGQLAAFIASLPPG
jgi:tetratricopeptide (TPR) repeat protein